MRYFFFVMGGLFSLFAYWQLNDPDSWVWVAEYGLVAILTFFAAFGRFTWFSGLVALSCLIWFFILAPAIGPGWIGIEEAREALGLLISSLWTSLLFIWWWRVRKRVVSG